MNSTTLDDKIRSVFGEFAVDKGLIRRMGVSGDDRHVPSYVMDWIVTCTAKTQKTTSSLERAVQEFVAKHLPAKGKKERIRFKLAQGEVLTVLDAISVTVKLSPEIRYLASIPCLDENKASIEESLLVQNEGLLQGSTWGAAKICYDSSDNGGGVRIIDFILREAGEYALVTEYADGGSLWDLLGGDEATDETRKPLDEKTVKAIAGDILAGLAALHEHEIVHRDIKPQNILRCDDLWKIADFGISKLMNNPVTGYTFQGAFTAPWAPPEQITGAPAHPSADVYAWARVVGYMLTGRTSVEKTLSVEPAWREILAPCIDFHAENRPAVSTLLAELERLPC